MTTNININVVNNELTSFAAGQTAINRSLQQDREEAGLIEREGLRRREARQFLIDRNKRYRYSQPITPEQLTAGGQDTSNIGHFWVSSKSEPVTNNGVWAGHKAGVNQNRAYADVDIFVGFKRTTRIYCGNGSSYAEIVHGVPDPDRQMVPAYTGFPPVTNPYSTTKACLIPWLGYLPTTDNNYNDDVKILAFPAGEDRLIILFLENYSTFVVNGNVPIFGNTRYDFPSEGDISAFCGPPLSGQSYPIDPNVPFSRYAEIVSPEVVTQYKTTKRCFICSNTSIREISIPSEMLPVLNYMQPQVKFETQIEQTLLFTGVFSITNYVAKIQVPIFTYNAIPDIGTYGDIFAPPTYSVMVTPNIYSALVRPGYFGSSPEDVSSYWQSLIGSIVNGQSPWTQAIVEDQLEGIYATTDSAEALAIFNSGEHFFYGRWKTLGEEPDYTTVEFSGFEFPVYDPSKYVHDIGEPFAMFPDRTLIAEESIDGIYMVRIWDWDRPNYCYAICRGLGFLDEDLAP